VWVPGETGGTRGSGYVLDANLVLTAGHVVDGMSGERCEVRPLGAPKWTRSTVVWRGDQCDAALIRVSQPVRRAAARVRFGRFETSDRADVRAVGFPQAQAKQLGRLSIVDTEDVYGQVTPLSGVKGGTLTLHVAGSTPAGGRDGRQLWAGMSGAALFSGPLLVGIVGLAPAHFGTGRLEAVPVEAMAAEAGFGETLAGRPEAPLLLEVAEDVDVTRDLLLPPYRPLPDQALAEGAIGFLLEPGYGIVPFHGRQDELDEHALWCGGSAGVAVRLVTGSAGAGKTRFAAELCRRQQAAGGVAGFLDPNGREDRIAGLARVSSPLLVVVDEAQSRIGEIALLLGSVAAARRQRAARILLLSRDPGEWWPAAVDRSVDGAPDGRVVLKTASLRKLAPLDDEAGREQSFLAAATAFAERLGKPAGELTAPALPADVFSEVVMVHLAALSAIVRGADGGRTADGGPTAGIVDELIAFALGGEARYWAKTARARELGLDQPVLEAAVAVATLMSAASQEEAAFLLRAVPDLVDAPEQTVRRTARWLRELYPLPAAAAVGAVEAGAAAPGGWFRPLGPALLGEALIARVLGTEHTPELAERALSRARSPDTIHRALTTLNQTASRDQGTREALERALRAQLPALWRVGIVVAQQTGDPIGQLMARALDTADARMPTLAAEIAERLPPDSVALREFALAVARQRVRACGELPASAGQQRELADALTDLAQRLIKAAAAEESLQAAGAAVAVSRRIDDPLRLALSLAAKSNSLEALGRRSEALAPIEEAVTILRTLREHEPDTLTFELASALASYAATLSDADRELDAHAALVESVLLFQTLLDRAQTDPVEVMYRIAGMTHNLAARLGTMGRAREALEASVAAVDSFRQLSELNPDAYLPTLADTLANHSNRLWAVHRPAEAFAALDEAISIYRALAGERPDVFALALARGLRHRSKRLRDAGRGHEAMAVLREAIEIDRDASARHDGQAPAELAVALQDQCHLLAMAGRGAEAIAAIEEAVGLERTLAAAAPDDYAADLATALATAAGRYGEQGRYDEAVASATESVKLYRTLADMSPGGYDRRLGMALGNQATALKELGLVEQAIEANTASIAAYLSPDNKEAEETEPDLAATLLTQAQLLASAGRAAEAFKASELAVTRFRALAARHRSSPASAGLARSLAQHALFLSRQDEYDRASALGGEAIGIFRSLLKTSRVPGLMPELAAALINQANALSETNRERAALAASTEAVAAFRELGPAYAAFLGTAYETQSGSLRALGRETEAARALLQALYICARPPGTDPEVVRLGLLVAAARVEVLEHRRSPATPEEHSLDDAAVTAIAVAADAGRQLIDHEGHELLPMLPSVFVTRFQLLSELGRRREALIAMDAAIATLRILGDDDGAWRARLAGTLDRHGADLGMALGPGPDGPAESLTAALRELAQRLAEDQPGDALAALAAGIRRQLAITAPDAFAVPVAMALRERADLLTILGRISEALLVAEETLAILRESGRTDDAAAAELAAALDRQAISLDLLGQREQAVEVIAEAVEIARRLLAQAADSKKDDARRNLALTLHTLGRVRGELGCHQAAVAAFGEALSVAEPMGAAARSDPMITQLKERLPAEIERLSRLADRPSTPPETGGDGA
jgi:tetratricopeptide (TPR) repeat protein